MPKSGDCRFCTTWTGSLYKCNYCGQHHCPDHRLPEHHECPALEQRDTDTWADESISSSELRFSHQRRRSASSRDSETGEKATAVTDDRESENRPVDADCLSHLARRCPAMSTAKQ